jgi:hypothetical protein
MYSEVLVRYRCSFGPSCSPAQQKSAATVLYHIPLGYDNEFGPGNEEKAGVVVDDASLFFA